MMKKMSLLKGLLVAILAAFILCGTTNSAHAQFNYSSATGGIGAGNFKESKAEYDAGIAHKSSTVSVAAEPAATSAETASSGKSSSSSGASGDIFKILQKKIYNTLVDLRKIVYVISGFGLVAFAVAAIFNKISYKHLGYIMISLCLLALMFPFLEYFSGYSLESAQQKELTFKNFLAASDYSRIRGEIDADILNGKGEKPGEPGANDEMALAMKQANADAIKAAYTPQGIKVDEKGIDTTKPIVSSVLKAEEEQKQKFAKAGCDISISKEGGKTTSKSSWDKNGSRTVCEMDENGKIKKTTVTCQGKVKNGVCKATFGQKVASVTNVTQNAIAVGTAGIASAGNAISMAKNAKQGGDALANIAKGDGKWYDKINDMANVTTNTFGSNGTATRDAFDILANFNESNTAMANISKEANRNYENNPQGKNAFADAMKNANDYANKNVGGTMGKIGDGINQGASTGRDIHSQATNVNEATNRAKNVADQWNGLFNPDQTEAAKQQRAYEAQAQANREKQAAEQAKKEAEKQAAEQQKAVASLTQENIQQLLDSGVVTEQQAADMTASMKDYQAKQAKAAQEAATKQAQDAQAKADAANKAVENAQAALANAQGADIAKAVENLQNAQAQAEKANQSAQKANDAAQKASDAATAAQKDANAAKQAADASKQILLPAKGTSDGNSGGESAPTEGRKLSKFEKPLSEQGGMLPISK